MQPHILDYYNTKKRNFNWLAFFEAESLYENSKHTNKGNTITSKAYVPRDSFARKDKKNCQWYVDYVIDEDKKFENPNNRFGKIFRRRFIFDKKDVNELIIQYRPYHESRHKKYDAFGRESNPLELLILGSLRILARNWTFDCLYEATYISETSFRLFFS